MQIDEAANELYVADGYLNRRVLVLDSRTGAYKRHWGAYGRRPSDDKQPSYDPKAPLSEQFANPVHCVRLSHDGFVYVCDRVNDRIQVFRKDGTFVKEFRVEPQTLANGSVWDLVLSEDSAQNFIFIADRANNQIVTLKRESGEVLTMWGRGRRNRGSHPSPRGAASRRCGHCSNRSQPADAGSRRGATASGWANRMAASRRAEPAIRGRRIRCGGVPVRRDVLSG